MIDWLIEIIICAFVVFRLAELLARDEIAFKVREWAGVYELGENGEPVSFLGKLFSCPYCLGVWFAFMCALWFDPSKTIVITWLAIAGMQAFLQTIGGRNNG